MGADDLNLIRRDARKIAGWLSNLDAIGKEISHEELSKAVRRAKAVAQGIVAQVDIIRKRENEKSPKGEKELPC